MKTKMLLLGAAAGVTALIGLAAPASAYVVCNREGDCWHTEARYRYPGAGYRHYGDDWYFHRRWEGDNQYHYRDYHEGRGYYRNGVWITF